MAVGCAPPTGGASILAVASGSQFLRITQLRWVPLVHVSVLQVITIPCLVEERISGVCYSAQTPKMGPKFPQ